MFWTRRAADRSEDGTISSMRCGTPASWTHRMRWLLLQEVTASSIGGRTVTHMNELISRMACIRRQQTARTKSGCLASAELKCGCLVNLPDPRQLLVAEAVCPSQVSVLTAGPTPLRHCSSSSDGSHTAIGRASQLIKLATAVRSRVTNMYREG